MHSSFRTPAWFYFLFAFVFTWVLWLVPVLASRGVLSLGNTTQLACLFVGSFGPFIGAFLAVYRDGGWLANLLVEVCVTAWAPSIFSLPCC